MFDVMNLPAPTQQARFTNPRPVRTGRECWWRLGRNIRDRFSDADGYGVVDVHRCNECTAPCGHFTIVLTTGEVSVSSLEYRVRWGVSVDLPDLQQYSDPRAVDVLAEHPPLLPDPTPWQQMTYRGDHRHPGEDMRNWRYDNPW